MSIFASDTTVTLEIPFDPPHTVTVQKLNGRQLAKAQKAFFNDIIADVQTRGGAKVQKDIQTLFEKDPAGAAAEVEAVKADPLNGYDKHTLLYHGIKGWTYPASLDRVASVETTADGRLVTVMRIPAIDDLDDDALDFFATEIMKLTKPSLFLNQEDAKAAQKEMHAVSPVAGR